MKNRNLLLALLLAGTVLCSLAACKNTDQTDTTTTKESADAVLTPSEELILELSADGASYKVIGVGNCTDSTVVIPATFEGKPVTAIGEIAFFRCQTVEEVVIPEGITTIETSAFTECTKLARVTLPDSLTDIGISAFWGCKQLREITIPEKVRRIGREAFSECDKLDSIVFEAADRWYSADYEGSGSGAAMNLSDPVANGKMEWYSWYYRDAEDLEQDENGLKYRLNADKTAYTVVGMVVGEAADVEIPAAFQGKPVTAVGDYAFAGCRQTTGFALPDSITQIGKGAFVGCRAIKDFVIPNGMTEIPENMLGMCENLQKVTIPDTVTVIGSFAFIYCGALTDVTLPAGVTVIGEYAFRECTALKDLTIPASVERIGKNAFISCDGLERLAFENREGWTSIHPDTAEHTVLVISEDPADNTELLKNGYPCVRR